MQKFITRVPIVSRIVSVILFVLFFVPFYSDYGMSFSILNILLGTKYRGITVVEGEFWTILILLVPLAITILGFINNKIKNFLTLGLVVIGFIVTGVLGNTIGGSWIIVLYVIGYIGLLILASMQIMGINQIKFDDMSDTVKNVITSENVQRGLNDAKQTALKFSDKVKTTVSDISNLEGKKANSIAEQLKTYKELLDQNIITQDEFEMKKKEILKDTQKTGE